MILSQLALGPSGLPSRFRVRTHDGRELVCDYLLFDRQHTAIRMRNRDQPEQEIPLSSIDTVSLRSFRFLVALVSVGGILGIGQLAGGFLADTLAPLSLHGRTEYGMVLGVLASGFIVWKTLRNNPLFWRWTTVYSKPAA